MTETLDNSLDLRQHRFARFGAISWWDQSLLRQARVLVIGAGALGNEVIKDLALLGVGHLAIADMDQVEESNLSRSVLFRPSDQGKDKARCAARAARDIYPDIVAAPLVGNILADLGLGFFRWAQVVVGALDNREARVFVNRACAQVGRPWIDGGIEVLNGVVRAFAPPQTACYECTMGPADWQQINKRRSCSLLARQALAEGGAPTTPTTASIIGAMQAQEVVKRLHGLDSLAGSGFVFEGLHHSSYQVSYPISPDCPWHEPPTDVVDGPQFSSQTPLRQIAEWASQQLGGCDAIDLSRELVEELSCPKCGRKTPAFKALDSLTAEQAVCDQCGGECVPGFVHSIEAASPLLERSGAELGLPRWDVLWVRHGQRALGIELTGDRPAEFAAVAPQPLAPADPLTP